MGLQVLHFSKDFDTMLPGKSLAMLTQTGIGGIIANWIRNWQKTGDLVRLLSALLTSSSLQSWGAPGATHES